MPHINWRIFFILWQQINKILRVLRLSLIHEYTHNLLYNHPDPPKILGHDRNRKISLTFLRLLLLPCKSRNYVVYQVSLLFRVSGWTKDRRCLGFIKIGLQFNLLWFVFRRVVEQIDLFLIGHSVAVVLEVSDEEVGDSDGDLAVVQGFSVSCKLGE